MIFSACERRDFSFVGFKSSVKRFISVDLFVLFGLMIVICVFILILRLILFNEKFLSLGYLNEYLFRLMSGGGNLVGVGKLNLIW